MMMRTDSSVSATALDAAGLPTASAPVRGTDNPLATRREGLNVIVPMGGIGSRFAKSGYRYPKPMINIVGRPMLFWLIDNLKLGAGDTLWLAMMRCVDEEFQIAAQVQREFKHLTVKTVLLEFETRGAAETLYIVTQNMSDEDLDRRTVSLDCDTIYFKDVLTPARALPADTSACVYFEDSGINAVYSYIALDARNRITAIREKVAISKYANTGAYVFCSGNALRHYAMRILDAGVGAAGEYYTSSIIADMVAQCGEAFEGIEVARGDFYCVGTPDQLDEFLQVVLENPGMVKKRRFCFDLDNTLVTMPRVAGDYSTCEPKWNNVRLCQQLKAAGHHIIIHTARRMKTHKGNIGAVIRDIGAVTIKQLEDFGIEYDELHFGKPWAHAYIDDLAVSALLDTGKEIGWYAPHEKARRQTGGGAHVNARSFNMVQMVGDKVIKTSSAASIDGEAFFHCHVPDDVEELFPKLYAVDYNADTRQTSISMGKVAGVTFSHLLVGSGLTPGRFQLLLQGLYRLHTSSGHSSRPASFAGCWNEDGGNKGGKGKGKAMSATAPWTITGTKTAPCTEGRFPAQVDVYANYHSKAAARVRSYERVYAGLGIDYEAGLRDLVSYFEGYQREGRAYPAKCIHGDPVFSNVLITKDSRIQFIDMRGRVGDFLTTAGDALYDLAKVYQSTCGYDYIILDRPINKRELKSLQDLFWAWVERNYIEGTGRDAGVVKRDIRAATALLVFTLIPLHDNEDHHKRFVELLRDLMAEAQFVC